MDGSKWRINFSRVEWDRDVVNGQYVPRLRPGSHRRLPEHNWVWSPQGIIDMHAPEKWGYLQFSSHNGGVDTVAYVPPADEAVRAVLWKVYYAQKEYWRKHGSYAGRSLAALGMETPDLWMKAADLAVYRWRRRMGWVAHRPGWAGGQGTDGQVIGAGEGLAAR